MVNPRGLNTILLLWSLYLTVTVVVIPGVTVILTVSPTIKPWVDAVDTVIVFLVASAETAWVLTVSILCFVPVPIPVKERSPELIVVSAIPTKVPVDPIPTLNVWMPIISPLILAT